MSSRFRQSMAPAFSSRQVKSDEPQVVSSGTLTCLRFSASAMQSAMFTDTPNDLVLGYTRTMMGFLLFNVAPARIGMIGLGGGSLAKYCRQHLPASQFLAVESNAKVIALRELFHIPPDDQKFQVIHANGEDWVRERATQVDVLLLDGYSISGIPVELSEQGFYDSCQAKLADDGILVANFSADDPKSGIYAQRLRASFDGQAVSIEAADLCNRIMFAFKGQGFASLHKVMAQRALAIRRKLGIDFQDVAARLQERLLQQCRNGDELVDEGDDDEVAPRIVARNTPSQRSRRRAT